MQVFAQYPAATNAFSTDKMLVIQLDTMCLCATYVTVQSSDRLPQNSTAFCSVSLFTDQKLYFYLAGAECSTIRSVWQIERMDGFLVPVSWRDASPSLHQNYWPRKCILPLNEGRTLWPICIAEINIVHWSRHEEHVLLRRAAVLPISSAVVFGCMYTSMNIVHACESGNDVSIRSQHLHGIGNYQ